MEDKLDDDELMRSLDALRSNASFKTIQTWLSQRVEMYHEMMDSVDDEKLMWRAQGACRELKVILKCINTSTKEIQDTIAREQLNEFGGQGVHF